MRDKIESRVSGESPVESADAQAQSLLQGRESVAGVTIDDPSSPDLDDAIWIRRSGQDRILTVSIADVAAQVEQNSTLDIEARTRLATRYGQTLTRHMLPDYLATDQCSLMQGERRPTFSMEVAFGPHGTISAPRFFKSAIEVSQRLNYQTASAALTDQESPIFQPITDLYDIALSLIRVRSARGALSLVNSARASFTTESGRVVHTSHSQFAAKLIVQECMILMNELSAHFLIDRGTSALFRCQAADSRLDRADILRELSRLVNVEALPERYGAHAQPIHQIGRGFYDLEPLGHFALATTAYCHITSPIRRFADLVNNRILAAAIAGEKSPYSREELVEICALLAIRDDERRLARRAMRESLRKIDEAAKDSGDYPLKARGFLGRVARACANSEFSPYVQLEISNRLNQHSAQPELMAILIFKNQGASAAAEALRELAFRRIIEHPKLAITTLKALALLEGELPPLETTPIEEPSTEHAYEAHYREMRSRVWTASKVNIARGLAHLELLLKLANRPDLLEQLLLSQAEDQAHRSELESQNAGTHDTFHPPNHKQTPSTTPVTQPKYSTRNKVRSECAKYGFGRPYEEISPVTTAEGEASRFHVKITVVTRDSLVQVNEEFTAPDETSALELGFEALSPKVTEAIPPRTEEQQRAFKTRHQLIDFCRYNHLPEPKWRMLQDQDQTYATTLVFVPGFKTIVGEGRSVDPLFASGAANLAALEALRNYFGDDPRPPWLRD